MAAPAGYPGERSDQSTLPLARRAPGKEKQRSGCEEKGASKDRGEEEHAKQPKLSGSRQCDEEAGHDRAEKEQDLSGVPRKLASSLSVQAPSDNVDREHNGEKDPGRDDDRQNLGAQIQQYKHDRPQAADEPQGESEHPHALRVGTKGRVRSGTGHDI